MFKKSNVVFIYIDRGRRYKISCSICGGGAALLYEKAIKFDDRWAIKSAHAALVIKGVLGRGVVAPFVSIETGVWQRYV